MGESWKYLSPTKITFELNLLESIKKYVLAQNIHQKILLVTGKSSMEKHGYVTKIKSSRDWKKPGGHQQRRPASARGPPDQPEEGDSIAEALDDAMDYDFELEASTSIETDLVNGIKWIIIKLFKNLWS